MESTVLTRDEFIGLAAEQAGPLVSLYLPITHTGDDVSASQLRLKNLLREADERLVRDGMRPTLALDLLQPANDLVNDRDFWLDQSHGLALFLRAGVMAVYRLPVSVPEAVVVGPRYHLKPLLPLVVDDSRLLVLTLSGNHVGLWEATRHAIEARELPGDTPSSQAEALNTDMHEKVSGFHTNAPVQSGQRRGGVFFGSGGADDTTKTDLLRYCQAIDRGLTGLLHDKRIPLVVAAVEAVHPIFREASSYPHLVPNGIIGNPDHTSPDHLLAQAWEAAEPVVGAARQSAADTYRELRGTGRTANAPQDVATAAVNGRVATLFVDPAIVQWGVYDSAAAAARVADSSQPGAVDLVDLAAVETLRHGGDVYVVAAGNGPDETGLAATFRY